MFTRMPIAILCLGWFVVPSRADEPPKYKPIDAKTIAAYEKLGAKYGGCGVYKFGRIEFSEGQDAAAKSLPGFRLQPAGAIPQLPPVEVPFGLNLSNTPHVTDAGLKELKDLKNLTTLALFGTQATDTGLQELKGLKKLISLQLESTQVTDAGLKELKGFEDLLSVYLHGTKVTGVGLKELKKVMPRGCVSH